MSEWLPERLPEDIEAERALLATCCAPGLERDAADVAFQLKEDDFVHPAHRAVFRAMRRLIEADVEINAITLKDTLDSAGDLSRVGDFAGLVEILSGDEVRNPQILAELLMRKRKLRDLIRLGAQLVRRAAGEEEPPETLVDQAGQELFAIAQGHDKRGLEHIAHAAQESMQNLQNRLEGRGSSGLRVGFSQLDEITQGFQPGNLIVLAARPSVGKTALALNWMLRASQRYQANAAMFSLEMSKEEIFNRLLSSYSQINMKSIAIGDFDDITHQKILDTRDELIRLPVFICDRAAITVREITGMVDKLCTKSGLKLDLVVVDYLQLISSPLDSRSARQSESVRIGEISRSLKLLAKEHNVPVVVLSQLNREVERRQVGRPQLSDLRDSGAIEQDADIVMFIHKTKTDAVGEQPEKGAETKKRPEMELIVAKHRNGPTGIIPLYFQGEFVLFRELEEMEPMGEY